MSPVPSLRWNGAPLSPPGGTNDKTATISQVKLVPILAPNQAEAAPRPWWSALDRCSPSPISGGHGDRLVQQNLAAGSSSVTRWLEGGERRVAISRRGPHLPPETRGVKTSSLLGASGAGTTVALSALCPLRVCRLTHLDVTSGPPKDTDHKNQPGRGGAHVPSLQWPGQPVPGLTAPEGSREAVRKVPRTKCHLVKKDGLYKMPFCRWHGRKFIWTRLGWTCLWVLFYVTESWIFPSKSVVSQT